MIVDCKQIIQKPPSAGNFISSFPVIFKKKTKKVTKHKAHYFIVENEHEIIEQVNVLNNDL